MIKKIIAAGVLAVVTLSLINITCSYSGIHIDNEGGGTDYVWEPYQLRTNTEEGFSWMTFDKNGFNNSDENAEKAEAEGVDILLMGSSHMEATTVDEDENLGYLLNENLPDKNTYNIGVSGHDIYRVVDNAAEAVAYYQPEEYLIIETDTITLEEKSMREVIDGTAKKIPSYDSGLIYYLQKIPAFKWIYKGLEEWMSQSKSTLTGAAQDTLGEENGSETYDDTLTEFLKMCTDACSQAGCMPIIFYHPEAELEGDGDYYFCTDREDLKLFAEICEKQGILFVDMTADFAKNYEENDIMPHGFVNTYTDDGHLNKYGHEMTAEKITKLICQIEKEK